MTLRSMSEVFNAGQDVELKFELPDCGHVKSGELTLRIDPEDRHLYMIGDKYILQLTPT